MMAAEIVTAGGSSSFFFRGISNSPDARRSPSRTYSVAKVSVSPSRLRKPKFTARMKGGGDDDDDDDERPFFRIPKIPANPAAAVAARAAVAVFALGFVDAGYSGDWSRIGAVSKEVEDWLKVAAFLVVPLCVLLVVSISGSTEEEA